MRKIASIAVGGVAGSILRFLIRSAELSMPLDTLAINTVGSFLLAIVLTLTLEMLRIHEDTRTGLTAGFFGAFTTFSSICQESVAMMSDGQTLNAIAYIFITTALGMAAAYAGYRLAKRLEAQKDSEEDS